MLASGLGQGVLASGLRRRGVITDVQSESIGFSQYGPDENGYKYRNLIGRIEQEKEATTEASCQPPFDTCCFP
jgi:hypothetical protein